MTTDSANERIVVYEIKHGISGQTLKLAADEKAARDYFDRISDVDGRVLLVKCEILDAKGGID